MRRFLSKFLYIIGERKHRLLLLILLFLVASLLDTLGIGLIGPFITFASAPSSLHQNVWLHSVYTQLGLESEALFISIFGLVITIIFYLKSFLSYRIQKYVFVFSYNVKGDLCKKLLQAYLSAPYTFHLSRNTALLIQNITKETNSFCSGVMLPIINSTAYVIVVILLGILLIKTDPAATAFILSMMLIPVLIYQHYKTRLVQWGKEISIAQVGMLKTINHSLGGFKETRMIGCESYFVAQLGEYVKEFEVAASSSYTFKLLPRSLIEAFLITFLVGFTSLLLLSNQGTQNLTGILGIFAVASIRLIPAVSQLTTSVGGLRNNSHAFNKLYYDLKEIEDVTEQQRLKANQHANKWKGSTQDSMVLPFSHQVVLDQITYTYPSGLQPAIQEMSLTLARGEAIALIGKSGAGKTTLVDLILGLLEPEGGDIQVDGVSIYSNLRAWQNLIGYIPQSIFLMDDTVARNIAFGVPDHLIDFDRLNRAIQDAQLAELLAELPQGIQTTIGERGVRLSGGQRQRIGIARVLYHEREILVLDEATSALDNETEKLVNEAIKSLSGKKTLIIIAHRLTTVEHCDRIYLLEKGQVVKSGSYRDVVLNASAEQHPLDQPTYCSEAKER
jgi:ATP-binding cassette, subfamily B, bacterial PglK